MYRGVNNIKPADKPKSKKLHSPSTTVSSKATELCDISVMLACCIAIDVLLLLQCIKTGIYGSSNEQSEQAEQHSISLHLDIQDNYSNQRHNRINNALHASYYVATEGDCCVDI